MAAEFCRGTEEQVRGNSIPSRLEIKSREIPIARILTFGYDAYVTDWRGVVSENRVRNHAWNLLTAETREKGRRSAVETADRDGRERFGHQCRGRDRTTGRRFGIESI
jgi:hypothetical protein